MTSFVLVFVPASLEPLAILRNLINDFPTKTAFPSIKISSIITKLFEDHGIAAAMTIHMNLLSKPI
jgi:hypothetical protein